MPHFRSLKVDNWRQFASIDFDLSQQITVLTGTNGTGKTTLLNTLTQHFGWNLTLVSTPRYGNRRLTSIWSDVYEDKMLDEDQITNEQVQIGKISYDNGSECLLLTSKLVSANYSLQYSGLSAVDGLYIPSHRAQAVHSPVQTIPTNPITAQQQYQQFQQLIMQAFGNGNTKNPGIVQKQSIISLAVFGEGNSAVLANQSYIETFANLQNVLRIMLPAQLGFERIEIRSGDVIMVTKTGDFSVDAMSGGVNALFGIAWQLSLFEAHSPDFTVIIDEPENHLHPSMQRLLLPNLAEAFPKARFIVATHSPFIVTSFPNANVYGLVYDENRRVVSEKMETADLSGTPNQILREILNVDSNLPAWVANKIESILIDPRFGSDPSARADEVMRELARLGLADALVDYEA